MSTKFMIISFGLILNVSMLLVVVNASAPKSEHVTVCFNQYTHRQLAKAFVNGKLSMDRNQGCGIGLVQVQLDLDTARELLGSIVATLNSRDQVIEQERIKREKNH